MFDRIKNSISGIEHANGVSADTFVEFLGCAIDDVLEQNGIEDTADLKVSEPENFLIDLFAALSALSNLYAVNKSAVSQFSNEKAGRFHRLEKEILEEKKGLEEVSADIQDLRKKHEELTSIQEKLEASRSHLLDLETKNDQLEGRIAYLSDKRLDKIDEENKRLCAELVERTVKEKTLQDQKTGLESRINEILEAMSDLPRQLDELTGICKKKLVRKNKMEEEITGMQERILGFEKWEAEFDGSKTRLQADYERLNTRIQTYVNIWTAESNQQFLQETLLGDNPLSDVKDYQDIGPWFEQITDAIEAGLSAYQNKLQDLIAASEKLTKK
jgi:chromosome segregation ATPase